MENIVEDYYVSMGSVADRGASGANEARRHIRPEEGLSPQKVRMITEGEGPNGPRPNKRGKII